MLAVIDCGTTNTRIYLVNEKHEIVASDEVNVGVRDTSISGSKEKLRNAVQKLFDDILRKSGIEKKHVRFAVASGMITSEIGLIEIPHLIAPAGIQELSKGIVKTEDGQVLSLGCPVYFIRGVKNSSSRDASGLGDLAEMDFMRGEEVQCVGILSETDVCPPCNIVVLSSHTKNIYINRDGQIEASCTTISGQLYDALLNATLLGSSLVPISGEECRHDRKELLQLAMKSVDNNGLGRTLLMARFMQVLMESSYKERRLLVDAAIAADDMNSFFEMSKQGMNSENYCLVGKKSRCDLYAEMLHIYFGGNVKVKTISDKAQIGRLTVTGNMLVATQYFAEKDAEKKYLRQRSDYNCSK